MLPAATSLKKQGANKGATTAFLITTPESGVDSITITYALLDPFMTVIRPIAAFVSGITAGLIENGLYWQKGTAPIDLLKVDYAKKVDQEIVVQTSLLSKIGSGLKYGFIDVWGDIVGWFFVGLLIAGFITAAIPDEFMTKWLGGGIMSMLIMLVAGIPLYICATASTPIAAALILKGISPGAALVFLLVGPATNITSLTVLFGLLGKKSTYRYLFIISLVAVIFGLGTDMLYKVFEITPKAVIGEAAEMIPYSIKYFSTGLLVLLSVKPLFNLFKKKFLKKKMVSKPLQTVLLNMEDIQNHNQSIDNLTQGGCEHEH